SCLLMAYERLPNLADTKNGHISSLDGGGSTTSYVIKNDEPEITGSDRFVSDVVAVLPALDDGLSVHSKTI
ncbi:MAG: hypothetical protein KA436_12720, partial [Oligoflexales bacterium]|nr:hypothetical protein [Oligoflexales bacterium]